MPPGRPTLSLIHISYRIQEEQQRKSIEITTAEANIAKQEKEILLKQKEAEVMEQSLDAQVDVYKRQESSFSARDSTYSSVSVVAMT